MCVCVYVQTHAYVCVCVYIYINMKLTNKPESQEDTLMRCFRTFKLQRWKLQ